jgi:putative transport protein
LALHWLKSAFTGHPELAIFLTMALGSFVGRLHYKSVKLGAVTGTLLAGVVVGQLHITIPDLVKTVAFIGFLFALGYQVGPQFFAGLKKGGVPQLILAAVNCVVGLGIVYAISKILHYGPGWGAGLLSGGLTQSSVIGVADSAINGLTSVSAAQKQTYINQIPVGYAVCYLVGTAAAAYFLSRIAPRLLGTKDLATASHDLEKNLGIANEGPDFAQAYAQVVRRTFRIEPGSELDGTLVTDEEQLAKRRGRRIFMYRYRRDGRVALTEPDTRLRAGDVVTVTAPHADFVNGAMNAVGTEVDDAELLSYTIETLPIVITNKEIAGKSIKQIREDPRTRLLYTSKLTRGGIAMPFGENMVLHRGDELTVQGPKELVEAEARWFGYAAHTSNDTDFSYIGLGIVIGGLIGIPTLAIASANIGLTTSGGALIMGLIFGWLRAKYPTFGNFPAAAQWIMSTGGLCMFVGIVGISSGPNFFHGVAQKGAGLVAGGLIVTLLPMILTMYLGRYLFKINTPVLLGITAGANTTTASIGAITEAAESQVPVLGYTIPYALSNTLLTIWGAIIVALLA